MAQPFLCKQARMRQRLGKRLCGMTQESRALTACHHERRHGDQAPVLARQCITRCVAFHKLSVVREGMGNGLELWPCAWHEVHHRDDKPRGDHPFGHEVLDRVISTIRCDQAGDVINKILWWLTIIRIDEKWRFVQRQFFNSETTGSRFEGKNGPRGQTPNVCRSASRVDERLYIFNFAVDRVGHRIATVAPASPVVVEYLEVPSPQICQLTLASSLAPAANTTH